MYDKIHYKFKKKKRKHWVTNIQGLRKQDGMTEEEREKDQSWQSGRDKGRAEFGIYYQRRSGAGESSKNVNLGHMKQKCSLTEYILHRPEERPTQAA